MNSIQSLKTALLVAFGRCTFERIQDGFKYVICVFIFRKSEQSHQLSEFQEYNICFESVVEV